MTHWATWCWALVSWFEGGIATAAMVLKSSLLKLWFEKCQTRKSLAIRWTDMLGNTEVLGRDQGAGGPAKGRGAGGKVSGFQLHVELTEQCWALHPPPPLPAIHTALSAGGSPSSKPQPDGPALQTWLRTCHLQGSVGQYVIWNNFSYLRMLPKLRKCK